MPDSKASERAREVVDLEERRLMIVSRSAEGDLVQFLSPSGAVTLSVLLTEAGPVLRFEGASLILQAAGTLSIEAEQLHLRGKSGLVVETGGDLELRAAGTSNSEAAIQNVTATRGDVNVNANDDVKLVGERVRVNC
jgi:hypothetical protein